MSYLIADSGSTKTDWCLLKKNKKPVHFHTQGINPFLQTPESIAALLQEELPATLLKDIPDAIYYYGAGAASKPKQVLMQGILRKHFGVKKVEVQSDMMAAAHALCGDEKE